MGVHAAVGNAAVSGIDGRAPVVLFVLLVCFALPRSADQSKRGGKCGDTGGFSGLWLTEQKEQKEPAVSVKRRCVLIGEGKNREHQQGNGAVVAGAGWGAIRA